MVFSFIYYYFGVFCLNVVNCYVIAIVIVEEAAEVLESHVLVSLTSSVEHLIMIGKLLH